MPYPGMSLRSFGLWPFQVPRSGDQSTSIAGSHIVTHRQKVQYK